jgi:hypothetical protein
MLFDPETHLLQDLARGLPGERVAIRDANLRGKVGARACDGVRLTAALWDRASGAGLARQKAMGNNGAPLANKDAELCGKAAKARTVLHR